MFGGDSATGMAIYDSFSSTTLTDAASRAVSRACGRADSGKLVGDQRLNIQRAASQQIEGATELVSKTKRAPYGQLLDEGEICRYRHIAELIAQLNDDAAGITPFVGSAQGRCCPGGLDDDIKAAAEFDHRIHLLG